MVSDRAVKLAVEFIVRIQQIKGDTPHTGFPDIGMYHKTVGIGDVDYQLFPIRLHYLFNRELPEILRFIIDCLLAVHGKRLVKITVTVQKSYGTKVHIAVRRLFQVIPRQHSQTAGIYLKDFIQAVFHAEISY